MLLMFPVKLNGGSVMIPSLHFCMRMDSSCRVRKKKHGSQIITILFLFITDGVIAMMCENQRTNSHFVHMTNITAYVITSLI